MPLISVILPVHDAADSIGAAVSSILSQTFSDFELLVVDDGSTDATLRELEQVDDRRVRIVSLGAHRGIASALNRGIDESNGELIARMDADDWAYPGRFRAQVERFTDDARLGMCGTFMVTDTQPPVRWTMPRHDGHIRARLLFASSFYHPTVMMRRAILDDQRLRYDPLRVPAEDYALWSRITSVRGFTLANVPEVLLRYHVRLGERTDYERRQGQTAADVSVAHATSLGLITSEEERRLWTSLLGHGPDDPVDPVALSDFGDRILARNDPSVTRIPDMALHRQIIYRWHLLGKNSGTRLARGSSGDSPSTTRGSPDGLDAHCRRWSVAVERRVSFVAGRVMRLAKSSSAVRRMVGVVRQGRGVVLPRGRRRSG